MAKNKSEKQEDVKVWTEDELKEQTPDQLAEIAEGLGISPDENITDEQVIKDILEAQTDDDATPSVGDKPEEDKPDSQPDSEGSDNDEAEITVTSEKRKGKTIFAVSGKPIVFDNEGKAKVCKADAEYLKNCPRFTFK